MALPSKHFGVLYDGSVQSKNALAQCVELCVPQKEQAVVHVLLLVEPPSTEAPWGLMPEEAQDVLLKKKKAATELVSEVESTVIKPAGLANYTCEIEVGDPRSWVSSFVEKYNLDYLFVGSRGLSGVKGFLLGSTSQYAMHNCPCTVAIVK